MTSYQCPECGLEFGADQEECPDGAECPKCHKADCPTIDDALDYAFETRRILREGRL